MDVKRVFTFLDVEERAGICVVMGFYIIQFGENDWLTGFFKTLLLYQYSYTFKENLIR